MKTPSILRGITSTFNKLWDQFLNLAATNAEPHVWTTRDHGMSVWHAYDPLTGESLEVGSEEDVRVWLEERYYTHGQCC
ncbi:MAG TPA: hypothetical protein IGS37_19880 [Synechococcales cyanobacterium M55_K2018_004]|nr:hypothetical protein [Synechococcales cyanobacterium M55_K2018_004]